MVISMDKIINEKYGCQILERDGILFIRFDEGEIVVNTVEYEITKVQAEKAMKSEKDAYEVILSLQNKK